MKRCTKCKTEKSINEFSKNKNRSDGLDSWCKECKKIYLIEYKRKNRLRIKEYHKEYWNKYYLDNKDARYKYNREYIRKKRPLDSNFRLRQSISVLMNRSLNGNKNGYHWENLVGYTQDDLRKHLESQFTDGMNWNNYNRNGWNIDHIIPISLFDIDGPDSKGFRKCWALDNLRPMWAKENMSKSNKLFY